MHTFVAGNESSALASSASSLSNTGEPKPLGHERTTQVTSPPHDSPRVRTSLMAAWQRGHNGSDSDICTAFFFALSTTQFSTHADLTDGCWAEGVRSQDVDFWYANAFACTVFIPWSFYYLRSFTFPESFPESFYKVINIHKIIFGEEHSRRKVEH